MNDGGNDPVAPLSGAELLDRLAQLDPESAARTDALIAASGPIGAQLFAARQHAQLDAGELGERAGIDPAVIVGIEHGTHAATRDELEQLGIALDIDFPIGKSSAA
jgi:hypothetical protein